MIIHHLNHLEQILIHSFIHFSSTFVKTISHQYCFPVEKTSTTFVPSFGVYFGNPVVSFSGVTVGKRQKMFYKQFTTRNITTLMSYHFTFQTLFQLIIKNSACAKTYFI